jgi:hypothetical protein
LISIPTCFVGRSKPEVSLPPFKIGKFKVLINELLAYSRPD